MGFGIRMGYRLRIVSTSFIGSRGSENRWSKKEISYCSPFSEICADAGVSIGVMADWVLKAATARPIKVPQITRVNKKAMKMVRRGVELIFSHPIRRKYGKKPVKY